MSIAHSQFIVNKKSVITESKVPNYQRIFSIFIFCKKIEKQKFVIISRIKGNEKRIDSEKTNIQKRIFNEFLENNVCIFTVDKHYNEL